MFYVIAHMSHHFAHGGLGMRPFIDLWLLLHNTEFNIDIVKKMCNECGILKFFEESTELAEYWLENKPITDMGLAFSRYCLQEGALGSQRQANASRQIDHKGISYIFSRIFVPDYTAREFYGDDGKRTRGYLYYQVKRWRSWLGKERRQNLMKQANELLKTDNDLISSTKQLMHWLEL